MDIIEKYGEYAEYVADIVGCDECFVYADKRILFGRGDLNPDIVFIGEGPNPNYDGKGMVFGPYAKSGPIFNRILESIGDHDKRNRSNRVKKFTYWVTNCAKCSSPKAKQVGNIALCSQINFGMEIPLLDPKVIVFFGEDVSKKVLNRKFKHCDIFDWDVNRKGKYIYKSILSYHPAARFSKEKWNTLILELTEKIRNLLVE